MLTSGRPPASLEIIGTPLAIASRAARPKLSFSEGNRKRSEKHNILSTSLLFPRNTTLSAIPRDSARASAGSFSGPSPTISNLEGIWFCTKLKI